MDNNNENTILSTENTTAPVTTEPVVSTTSEQLAPAPAPATYDYSKMITPEGALSENWRDGLPEAIRNEKCLDSIKTVATLAQSYVHAQKAIGANKVTIPTENSSQDEWDAFYSATGRPESADKYSDEKLSIPEGVELDKSQLEAFRKYAFDHGLSQKAYEAALSYDIQRAKDAQAKLIEARNQEYNSTLAKLQSEYGPSMQSVVLQCNKAMETFGLTDTLRQHGLLNNYAVIKALAQIGSSISETRLPDTSAPAPSNPQSRLNEIMSDPSDAYFRREHPGHAARVAEVAALLNSMKK